MRPTSVEIKVTIAEQVAGAVNALPLTGEKQWSILFCEDVTAAVTPSTPLLDLGVILRARRKSGSKGDSTVKLRPCRWSQLSGSYFSNLRDDDSELKIEADWAGPRHTLTASMTVDWADGRVGDVIEGDRPVTDLVSERQADFLDHCARGRVNLAALTALPAFAAHRWDAFEATAGGVDLEIRAERWTIAGGDDFLELSVVADPDEAVAHQAALDTFVTQRGLVPDQSQENKTQRILAALVNAYLSGPG